MIYRLLRWILNKFNYELVHFAEMKFLNDAVNYRTDICQGKYDLEFAVYWDGYGCPVTYNIFRETDCVYHHHGKYFALSEWSKCEMAGIKTVIDNLI